MIAFCLKNVVLFWCKRQVAAVPNKPKLVSSVNIYPPVHYVLMFLCQFKFLSLGQSRCHFLSTWFIIIPPAPRRGRGVYCFTSVRPSVQDIFRRIFLSNCWWQKSDIWSQASYRYTILWVTFLDPSDSYFLFADLVGFYTHWTCTFFSATIDGRNLIFGHKLHIGTPYLGKRFWTHQIPTSCLPILLIFIHI